MELRLDPTFDIRSGRRTIRFDSSIFPGGEPHIRILDEVGPSDEVLITHRINSFNDLGLLLIAVDALHRLRVDMISLVLPYFPAARQDRVMTPGESLSCKVYADLINGLGLEEVIIFDPHSDVVPALLDRCTVVPNHAFVAAVVKRLATLPLLISPDGGALKKIHGLAKQLGGVPGLECGKSRDVRTGALSGFRVPSDDLNGRPCLIVDDICDGGGTFLGLADELRKRNAGPLHLAISHGIFSKGTEVLRQKFDRLFTTDSIRSTDEIGVERILLGDLINS
jgi:ribose-phosphate pyrophosphokinase